MRDCARRGGGGCGGVTGVCDSRGGAEGCARACATTCQGHDARPGVRQLDTAAGACTAPPPREAAHACASTRGERGRAECMRPPRRAKAPVVTGAGEHAPRPGVTPLAPPRRGHGPQHRPSGCGGSGGGGGWSSGGQSARETVPWKVEERGGGGVSGGGAAPLELPGACVASPSPPRHSGCRGKCKTSVGAAGRGLDPLHWTPPRTAPHGPALPWGGREQLPAPLTHQGSRTNTGPGPSQTRTPGASVGFYKVCS